MSMFVSSTLRSALAAGDISTPLSTFTERSQPIYQEAFEDLSGSLSQMAAEMGGIESIYVYEDVANIVFAMLKMWTEKSKTSLITSIL